MAWRYRKLREVQGATREASPDALRLRVHRAISWIGRAEQAQKEDDPDAAFIFYWIAFNAAYAGELSEGESRSPGERQTFRAYFAALLRADAGEEIYGAIWERFAGPIRILLDNPYVFAPFWTARRTGADPGAWRAAFERSHGAVRTALERRDTGRILEIVFDRLYVLRNQLLHGGATWNSSVNRDQVRDGVRILGYLTPLFISLMMNHPELDWGEPAYPVVEE